RTADAGHEDASGAGGRYRAVRGGYEARLTSAKLDRIPYRYTARDAQHDARAGAWKRHGLLAQVDAEQLELRRPDAVVGHVAMDLWRHDRHSHGGVEQLQQFRHVDVLAGETGPHHIVGVREQLDPGAAQIGVQPASRHEHGLARLKHGVLEQQGSDDADVTWVIRGDPRDRGAGRRVRARAVRRQP